MGEQSGMPGFGRTEEDFSRVDVRRLVQALLAVLPAAHVLYDPRLIFDAKGRIKPMAEWPAEVAAAVVGVADARWGEVGHAFVEMTTGLTLDIDALNAHLASCLARFKRPQRIEQLDALPLTPSGKVHKVALRARAGG